MPSPPKRRRLFGVSRPKKTRKSLGLVGAPRALKHVEKKQTHIRGRKPLSITSWRIRRNPARSCTKNWNLKGFEAELIEPLLDKFEAAHLIDDAEYARSFVTQRGTGKKLSRSALRRELKERGITGDLAEEALAARTDEDERRDAAELVRKKLRPAMNFSDHTEKEKIIRRLIGILARHGYSSSVAFSVVKEEIERYCSEWEEDS